MILSLFTLALGSYLNLRVEDIVYFDDKICIDLHLLPGENTLLFEGRFQWILEATNAEGQTINLLLPENNNLNNVYNHCTLVTAVKAREYLNLSLTFDHKLSKESNKTTHMLSLRYWSDPSFHKVDTWYGDCSVYFDSKKMGYQIFSGYSNEVLIPLIN